MNLKKGIPERLGDSCFEFHIPGGAFEEQLKTLSRSAVLWYRSATPCMLKGKRSDLW